MPTREDSTYIAVHDGMPEHPKVVGLSDAAFRTVIEAWCYCHRNDTDGKLKAALWARMGTRKARAELLAAGLAEERPDGVEVHDYLDWQRSADEIAALKAKRRNAGKKGGEKTAKKKASATASATANAGDRPEQVVKQNGKQNASKTAAYIDTDIEVRTTEPTVPTSAQTVIGEWVDRQKQRPPGRVVGQAAALVGELIGEGFAPPVIGQALDQMSAKRLHPATLPSLVHGFANGGRGSTTDQRVNVGLEIAARLEAEGL